MASKQADEATLRTLHVDDLIELISVLRRDYAGASAERDRLRAVVDVLRSYLPLTELPAIEVDEQDRLALWLELRRQLRQLDASPDTGDGR